MTNTQISCILGVIVIWIINHFIPALLIPTGITIYCSIEFFKRRGIKKVEMASKNPNVRVSTNPIDLY